MIKSNQISYPAGYSQAINWYKKLKQQFFNQLSNTSILEGKEIGSEYLKTIETELVTRSQKDIENKKLSVVSRETLQSLMKDYIDSIISENKNKNINKIVKQLQDAKDKTAQEQLELINKLEELIIKEFQNTKNIQQNLTLFFTNRYGLSENQVNERYAAILTRAQEFIKRAIVERWGLIFNLYRTSLITMSGYIAEELEFQGIQKYAETFTNKKLRVTPGGTKTSKSGRSTHMDNILSLCDFIDEDFSAQISVTETGPFINKSQAQEKLLQSIKYYGEQVKTFSLTHKSSSKTLIGARISEQSDLRKQYEDQYKNSIYDIYTNIKFMGQYSNILQSFGADTLLFANSDKRYFMSDFITEFKKMQYYLMFGYTKSDGGTSTENIQSQYIISKTVVLDKPWYSLGKNKKNTYLSKTYQS